MRRLGRFFVSEQILLNDQHVGARIFQGLVVLEANHRYDRAGTEYLAQGEVFDEVPEGTIAPIYDVQIDQADGSVNFVRENDNAGTDAAGW